MAIKNFSQLVQGDGLFTLEQDRRSGYPIFDRAQIQRVGESKPMASPNGGYINNIALTIQDSVSPLEIYLPSESIEGIYNGVYYTTDIQKILSELEIQDQKATGIIQNIDKYKAISSECKRIKGIILNGEAIPEVIDPLAEIHKVRAEMANYMKDTTEYMKSTTTLINQLCDKLGCQVSQ